MPKQKPENKLSDKEQWERFTDAAKKAGVDKKRAEKVFEDLKPKRETDSSKSSN